MSADIKVQSVSKIAANPSISAWDLFIGADFIVQLIMVILLLSSFWTWVIIFEKNKTIKLINKKTDEFEHRFWDTKSLTSFYNSLGHDASNPIALIFIAAMREWQTVDKVVEKSQLISLQERINRVMQSEMSDKLHKLEKHMTFLASVGSTAPFIGLFGTVWGIMNSFQGIAMSGNTSLSVVAPGIAEALLATAFGLVAAIPAVLGYNKLSGEINNYALRLENFCDTFSTIISRKCAEYK